MNIKKIRKQILEGFLDNIYRISDKEYQKRVWIEGRGPECHDFDEAVCDFIHEGDSIIENYRDFGIKENQNRLLIEFREKFKKFSDENDFPQEFIDTPEWKKIMELANEVLKAFNYEKKSQ